MGAIMQSIWISYSLRVYEPQYFTEEAIRTYMESPPLFPGDDRTRPKGLELLDEYEKIGGEDESFREHVRQHITKWNAAGDDPYWNFDKRIHAWINKVFDHRIELGKQWMLKNGWTEGKDGRLSKTVG